MRCCVGVLKTDILERNSNHGYTGNKTKEGNS